MNCVYGNLINNLMAFVVVAVVFGWRRGFRVFHFEGGPVLVGESLWWQRLQLHKIFFTTRLVNSAMDLLLAPRVVLSLLHENKFYQRRKQKIYLHIKNKRFESKKKINLFSF